MRSSLSPVRMDATLTADVAGEVLTLNDAVIDLSGVTEAAPLADHGSPRIIGPVLRGSEGLELSLILRHGGRPPQETLFPAVIEVVAGPVPLPPYDMPQEEQGTP
jgi:hypothetical protein